MLLLIACGAGAQDPDKAVDPSVASGGRGGSRGAGGGGGATNSGGSGGGASGGVMPPGSGGGTGSGGTMLDAAAPDSGGSAAGGAGPGADADASPAGDSGTPGDVASGGAPIGFYEAEAIAPAGPNQLLAPAVVNGCPNMGPTCTAETLKPEASCCSAGKEVRQLLRGRGGLQFNKIAAPTDGMYDVTWWYHCGKNDNFGDGNCGGEPNHPAAGCRPHVLTINGTRQPKVFEFHCFPGPWGQIHAVTTPLPLKAGDNSIRVVATPGRDAADLDAIAIFPPGQGVPPVAFSH